MNNPIIPNSTSSDTERRNNIIPEVYRNPRFKQYTSLLGGTRGFDDSKYLAGIAPFERNPNDIKAANQGFWSELGNSFAQTGAETLYGSIEGTGYLGQLLGVLKTSEDGFANDLSNWAHEKNQEFKEEKFPVYNSSQYASPSEWFFENMPSIASAVSLMVPSMGVAKLTGALSKILGGSKLLKVAGIMKNSAAYANTFSGIETLTSALASRHMENMMEGKEQYDRVYQESLAKGFSEEYSKEAALKAGKLTYGKNWALLGSDILQYGLILRNFKGASNLAIENEIARKSVSRAKALGIQMGTEAGEEGYQFIQGEEAARQAKIEYNIDKEDYKTYTDRLLEYASSGDFWTSAFFGALGGGVFDYAGNKINDWSSVATIEKQKAEKEIIKQQVAVLEKDPTKFKETQDAEIFGLIGKGLQGGRVNDIKSLFQNMIDTAGSLPTEEEQLEQKAKGEQALKDLEEFEELFNRSTKINTPDVTSLLLMNRMQQKITERVYDVYKDKTTKELNNINKENNLTSDFTLALEASVQNNILNFILENNKDTEFDKNLIQDKIKKNDEIIKLNTDSIKTRDNVTDADLVAKMEKLDLSLLDNLLFERTINEIRLSQITKEYNELNTAKGKEETQKKVDNYKKEVIEAEYKVIEASLKPNTTTIELTKLKETAEKLGKKKEFEQVYQKLLTNQKAVSPKFNPNDVTNSLTARWENNDILRNYELKVLDNLYNNSKLASGVILDEKTVSEQYLTNSIYKTKVDNYFKQAHALAVTPITNQTLISDTSGSDPKISEINKDKQSLNPTTINAWKTKSYQFKWDNKEAKFERDENGQLIPDNSSIAEKIDWNLLNSGKIPIGATLHYEYDFDDDYNKKNGKLINLMLIELVYYKDGNENNKLDSNRSVVGVLSSFDPKKDYGSKENSNSLYELRKDIYNEVVNSPVKEGYITLKPTTKVVSYFANGGQLHNTKVLNNPYDVLRQEDNLLLGIGQMINQRPVLNVNNHPISNQLAPSVVDEGKTYIIISDNNGGYLPVKGFVPLAKDVEGAVNSVLPLLEALKTAKTKEDIDNIVKSISEIVSIRYAFYSQGQYTIGLGSEKEPEDRVFSDATAVEEIGRLMVQVDINKINKGNYNKELADKGWIKLDLMPITYFHSTSLNITPYVKEEVKLPVKKQEVDKKTNIEKRRNSNLEVVIGIAEKELKIYHAFSNTDNPKWIAVTTNNQLENKSFNTKQEAINFVNVKYDAEIAALNQSKEVKQDIPAKETTQERMKRLLSQKIDDVGSADIDLGTPGKFKTAEEVEGERINEQEVKAWFVKNLPQIPTDVIDGLIEIKKNGGTAFGKFKDALITLSKAAPKGTEHHEAFHAVFNLFLNKDEQNQILDDASKLYKTPRGNTVITVETPITTFNFNDSSYYYTGDKYKKSSFTNEARTESTEVEITKEEYESALSEYGKNNPTTISIPTTETYNTYDLKLEEFLADDFMEYVRNNGNTTLPEKIKAFFKRIWESIKAIFNNDITIDKLMYRINTGYYANSNIIGTSNDPKYKVTDDPITAKKRVNAINYLFFEELDKLRNSSPQYEGKSDIALLAKISEEYGTDNKETLKRVYGRINNGIIDRIIFGNDSQYIKDELTNIVNQFFKYDEKNELILTEGYFGKAINNLALYGILVKEKEIKTSFDDITNDDSQFEKNEEETLEQSYSDTAIHVNPKDTLTYNVRKMLRQTKRWVYNKSTNTFETNNESTNDDLGFQTYISFDELDNYLRTELADIYDIDEMLLKIGELQYNRPELHGILIKLEENNELASSFFSAYSTQYTSYMQLLKEVRYDSFSTGYESFDASTVTFKLFNANRHSINQLIIDEWNSNLKNTSLNEITDKDGKINTGLAKLVKEEYESIVKEFQKSKIMTPEIAIKLHENLKRFGITINPQIFTNEFDAKIRASKKRIMEPYIKMINLLIEGGNSIGTIIDSLTLGKNPYEGITTEAKSISTISKIVGRNEAQLHQDNIISIDGKSTYSYTLPTFFAKKLQELKDEKTRQNYINNWWFSKSRWLQDINNTEDISILENLVMGVLDGSKFEDFKNGSKYFNMSDKELSITDINLFENNYNTSFGWYRLPLLSDGSNAAIIKFKKYTKEEIIEGFYQIALAEQERINRISNKLTSITEYDKNGLQYQLVTVFNKANTDINNPAQAREEIKKWLEEQFEVEKQRLKSLGILNADNSFAKDTKGRSVAVDDRRNSTNDAQVKLLNDYFYNKIFASSNLIMLSSVDPSFYKAGKDGSTYNDFMKRNGQVFKFTQMLNTKAVWKDGTATGETYSGIYLNDNYVSSKELQQATIQALLDANYTQEEAETVGSLYLKVNQTDAQSYITIDRYKKIMIGYGQWTDVLEEAFQRIKTNKPINYDYTLFLQPIKPFYYDHIDVDGITTPTQHKNSEVVLLPQIAKINPKLKKLLNYMEDNNIDSALFTSAVKVGENGSVDFDNFKNAKIHTFNNKYYGKSQVVPVHHVETDNKFGTQIRKLIFNDLDKDIKILGRTKEEIFNIYQKLITDNILESYNLISEEFQDIDNIQKILLDQIRERNLGESYEDAVRLVYNDKGEKVFNIPLFDPIQSRRMQNILNSIIRNNVFVQKINGASLVLMSNFGFSEKLRVITNKDTGAIEGMEVMLPSYLKDKFPKLPNGEIDIESIKETAPELLELFGYRIPTEHFYSMKKLIIKGFTPNLMGGIAILPAEITTIAGEDFDIDKLYVMIPNWELVDGKPKKIKYDLNKIEDMSKKQRDNAIIDIMSAVWTHPTTTVNILNPGNFDRLKRLANEISSITQESVLDNNIIFPINEMRYFNDFTNGAELIGIAANHNTNHAITQYSNLALSDAVKVIFNNENKVSYLRELNEIHILNEDKYIFISRSLAEFIAAFVDNAKEPVANKLNLNSYTFDTVALLNRVGLSIETSIYFINQPIIRELTKRYINYGKTKSGELKAIEEIKQYFEEILPETLRPGIYPIKEQELPNMLAPSLQALPNSLIREQNAIFNTFIKLKESAQSLATLVKATKVDTSGTGQTMADNNFALQQIDSILTDKNLTGVDTVLNIPLIRVSNKVLQDSQTELLGKYFPFDGKLFVKLLEIAKTNKGQELTQAETNYLHNQFVHYYNSSFDVFDNKHKDAFINQFPSIRFSEYKVDPEVNQFELMKYLRLIPVSPDNKIARVEFSSSATLSNEQREKVTDSWMVMLGSDNPKIKKAATDLVKYSFYTTYFGYTFSGYSHLIPINYLENLKDSRDISYRDHMYQMIDQKDQELYITEFLDQIYRHQNKDIKLLRAISREETSKLSKPVKGISASIAFSKELAYRLALVKDDKLNTEYVRFYNKSVGVYHTYKYTGFDKDGNLVYNIRENLGFEKNILEFGKDTGVETVLKQNKLPQFKEEDYITTTSSDPNQGFYQLEDNKAKEKANQELNDLLKTWASSLGITIEYHNDLMKRLGIDAKGVADLYKKLILISQGKETIDTLPEEIGHFAEGLSRGQVFHNRLMEIVHTSPTYQEVVAKYGELYSNDEIKLKQEAIGKLIGDAIIKRHQDVRDNTSNIIMQFLTALWNKFISIFKKANIDDIQSEINKLTSFVAEEILAGKTESFKSADKIKIGDTFYSLAEDMDVTSEQDMVEDAINSIYKKIQMYEQRASHKYAEKENKVLDTLLKEYNDSNYELGLLKYLNNAKRELSLIADRYNVLLSEGEAATTLEQRKELIITLRSAQNYIAGFKSTVREISLASPFRHKRANDIADKLSQTIDRLEQDYYRLGKGLLTQVFRDFSTHPDIDMKKVVNELDKDISFFQKNFDAMAEASDPILKILDKIVKESIQRNRMKMMEQAKDLIDAQKEMEAAGVTSTNWIYERDFAGNITGRYLSEYNWGEYIKRKNEWFANNPKPNRDNFKDDKAFFDALDEWQKSRARWFANNTQSNPKAKELIEKKRSELVARLGETVGNQKLAEWLNNNSMESYDLETGQYHTKYIKELGLPSDKYLSRQYADIISSKDSKTKAMKKYYDTFVNTLEKQEELLPEVYRLHGKAPQVRKDFFERLSVVDADGKKRLRSGKDLMREGKETLSELVIRKEDDIEFGLTDESGNPINNVPMHFVRPIKDVRDLSLDATSSLIAYMNSASNYKAMSDVVDIVELSKDVLAERMVLRGTFDPVVAISKLKIIKNDKEIKVKKVSMPGTESQAYKRFVDYVNMVVYGQQKKDESYAKLLDTINQYTSLNNLALNLYSGVSNITFGNIMTRMEGFAGELIDHKSLLEADKIYTSELPHTIKDIGQRSVESKLNLWTEIMDTFQDYNRELNNADAGRNTVFSRLFKQSSLYFVNRAGEHYMQSRLSLALANKVKVKDSSGNIMSLWEAYEKVNVGTAKNPSYRLKLKEGVTKVGSQEESGLFKVDEDGKPLTERDIIRFINRQNFLNKRLHGIYNNVDKSAFQQYAIGRMAMMFRKFLKPGWNRRFEKLTYNEEGEIYTEGYYTTTWNFLKSLFTDHEQAKFQLGAKWDQLSKRERRNIIRTISEVSYMFATAVLASALTQLGDDDDENYLIAFAAYEAYRTHSELSAYINYQEGMRILKSPAAAINQINNLTRLIAFWDWMDVYEAGKYKGLTKFEVSTIETIPLTRTYYNFHTPDEQLKFFSNNPPLGVSIIDSIYK